MTLSGWLGFHVAIMATSGLRGHEILGVSSRGELMALFVDAKLAEAEVRREST